MITADGWIDWAIRRPGPANKVNGGVNAARGIFLHSAEGYVGGLWSQLVGAPVSWHLSNLFDGSLYQHYPLTAQCWHATAANNLYIGVEHEGRVPNEPTLTPAQIATSRRVIAEVAAWRSWTPSRPKSATDTSHTLWEHREVVRLGGTGSSCPNGRIPWALILAPDPPPSPPNPQEDTDMITHLMTADWFNGRTFAGPTPPGDFWLMQAKSDFDLPGDAKAVVFTYRATGRMSFYHGSSAIEGPSSVSESQVVRAEAVLDEAGTLNFRVEDPLTVEQVTCLGFYR